ILSMCARIAAASAARSSVDALATKRHKKHKIKAEQFLMKNFSVILEPFLRSFLCFICVFVVTFNNKYASGVSRDVNGIAARNGPAILWQRAIATTASLDDCVGRLDCAGRVCRHQSHRAGASARLGSRHVS